MLEAQCHPASWFVTLTYDDLNVPSDGSVSPRELQLFLKRLRERINERVRFYGVGEYGDSTGRPHYHLALFGLDGLAHVDPGDAHIWGLASCTCPICSAWGKGGVGVGDLTPQSAAYIVSYVTKRLTRAGDQRLDGKHPEFARMSLRPGIGAPAVSTLSKAVLSDAGIGSLVDSGDVPSVVRTEGKLWPLGRYIRGKIRTEVGMDTRQPEHITAGLAREMQELLREPGARDRREEQRLQDSRRAAVRDAISNSKKGIGV